MKRLLLIVALLTTAIWMAHAAVAPAAPAAPIAAAAPARPRGVHFVYLIRHGFYDRDTVQTDDRISSGLNALGHEQSRLIGARLAALPITVHSLVSSDFTRARETADEIGAILHMTPARDSLLRECSPTADNLDYIRNHTSAEIAAADTQLNAAWAKYFVPTPGADTYDVLVCHGNGIRWWTSRAVSGDPRHWSNLDIANASLTIIAVRPDGSARLVMFSDVGHLPLDKQTWSGRGGGWDVRAAKGMR